MGIKGEGKLEAAVEGEIQGEVVAEMEMVMVAVVIRQSHFVERLPEQTN